MNTKDFSCLNSIRGRSIDIKVTSGLTDTIPFTYNSFSWRFKKDKLMLTDGWNSSHTFSVLFNSIKNIGFELNEECHKIVDIITNTCKIILECLITEDEYPFEDAELFDYQKDEVGALTTYGRDYPIADSFVNWLDKHGNVIISILSPFTFQQVYSDLWIYDHDGFIALDGENTIACCTDIPKDRITEFNEISNKEATIMIDNYINVSVSKFKCKPKLYTRLPMMESLENGRMYNHE